MKRRWPGVLAEATIHQRLIALLDAHGARYRIVEHPEEGRSEYISRIRGNDPSQALKAIVVSVRGGGQGQRTALAVLPGNRRLDMKGLVRAMGAQKGRFASQEAATELTGCVMGAVPPFSFRDDLPLIADPGIKNNAEVCFNAGRLDRSVFIAIEDYLVIARPRFSEIAAPPEAA